jgi:hypothetical protein
MFTNDPFFVRFFRLLSKKCVILRREFNWYSATLNERKTYPYAPTKFNNSLNL